MKQKIQIPFEDYSIGKQGEERVSIPLGFVKQLLEGAGYEMSSVGNVEPAIVFKKKRQSRENWQKLLPHPEELAEMGPEERQQEELQAQMIYMMTHEGGQEDLAEVIEQVMEHMTLLGLADILQAASNTLLGRAVEIDPDDQPEREEDFGAEPIPRKDTKAYERAMAGKKK